MNIYLDPKHLISIQEILKKHGVHQKTYVFGSRARGDHKKYSDLDLLVKQDQPLETAVLVGLKDDFENSDLPFTVDLVEWCKISDDFKKNISIDLVLWPNRELVL